MWIYGVSAWLVGAIHSINPAHWLPVVAFARSKRWSTAQTAGGIAMAGLGHIVISTGLATLVWQVGEEYLEAHEVQWQRIFGGILVVFGIAYAAWSRRRHAHCHGHSHHVLGEPRAKRERHPYYFLFALGFSPCLASVPVFGGAVATGWHGLLLTSLGFAVGIYSALAAGTYLMLRGIRSADHPWLEHHGDELTGLALTLSGVLVWAQSFWHVGH